MGGKNSTRWNGYQKKEIVGSCLVLDVNYLRHAGFIVGINGNSPKSIKVSLFCQRPLFRKQRIERKPRISLRRNNPVNISEDSYAQKPYQEIKLYQSDMPNGGKRWFFLCPLTNREDTVCHKRCVKLYQKLWDNVFGCRDCLALTYTSQQKNYIERKIKKLLSGMDFESD